MCGINGIVSYGASAPEFHRAVESMNDALSHRGPDDAGVFLEPEVGLGHRRLAIIDRSSSGHQPMQSADGRFVLVFNGEVYNFRELRSELDYPFRSRSDSEVLLAAWQMWGESCIDRLVGMFAFAIWDRERHELHLVRDRLGIKPLYYSTDHDRVIFSSEVRGVLASGLVPRRLNQDGVVDLLRYQCVHAPQTIVDGVSMLASGTHLRVSRREQVMRRYWTPVRSASLGDLSRADIHRRLREALVKSVERRLISDVPFGAFLSGGIDSSAIVALMSQVADKVSTFTVNFAEKQFSEAHHARTVAKRFDTDHHEIELSPAVFLDLLPEALDRMDHPSGDGPNTYVVSKVTKDAGITMALSGLGGDELFAGYSIFTQSLRLEKLRWLNGFPRSMRSLGARLLTVLHPAIATRKIALTVAKPKVSALSAYALYRQVWLDDEIGGLLRDRSLPANRVEELLAELSSQPEFRRLPRLSQISVAEMTTYMQNVLLRDTDQMSMAHALEVRVPFLDHELVELVLGIGDAAKYPHSPKQLLVETLADLLPPEIVDRPKMGFTLPFPQWMKGELREFCDLRLRRLAEREGFNHDAVLGHWRDLLAGSRAIGWSRVWTMVVLEHWLERNGVA